MGEAEPVESSRARFALEEEITIIHFTEQQWRAKLSGIREYKICAIPVPNSKIWHDSFSLELRDYIVLNLMKAIFPPSFFEDMNMTDPRVGRLVVFSQKIELEAYEAANRRVDYYSSLAGKIAVMKEQQHEVQEGRRWAMLATRGELRGSASTSQQQQLPESAGPSGTTPNNMDAPDQRGCQAASSSQQQQTLEGARPPGVRSLRHLLLTGRRSALASRRELSGSEEQNAPSTSYAFPASPSTANQ